MKKIVYCTYEIAIRGGEQRILINKANYLASHGYEVHFLTSDQQNRQPAFPLDKRVQMHDCEVNYTLELKQGSYWAKTKNFFRCLRKEGLAVVQDDDPFLCVERRLVVDDAELFIEEAL